MLLNILNYAHITFLSPTNIILYTQMYSITTPRHHCGRDCCLRYFLSDPFTIVFYNTSKKHYGKTKQNKTKTHCCSWFSMCAMDTILSSWRSLAFLSSVQDNVHNRPFSSRDYLIGKPHSSIPLVKKEGEWYCHICSLGVG